MFRYAVLLFLTLLSGRHCQVKRESGLTGLMPTKELAF